MRRRGERGETLAEVLVSTTLLGIIGIGIIGAIASVLISTDVDRRLSAGETVLRSYVAAIEQADYVPCARPSAYTPDNVGYGGTHDGYTPVVERVSYLHAPSTARPLATPADTVPLAFDGTCPTDPGVQKIDVTVRGGGSRPTVEHVSFVKRQLVIPVGP